MFVAYNIICKINQVINLVFISGCFGFEKKNMLLTGTRKKERERRKRRGRFSLQADFLVGVAMDTHDDFVKPLPLSLLRQCKLAVAPVD